MLRALYSASILEVAISVWSLLLQMIEQFETKIAKPVMLFKQEGSHFFDEATIWQSWHRQKNQFSKFTWSQNQEIFSRLSFFDRNQQPGPLWQQESAVMLYLETPKICLIRPFCVSLMALSSSFHSKWKQLVTERHIIQLSCCLSLSMTLSILSWLDEKRRVSST